MDFPLIVHQTTVPHISYEDTLLNIDWDHHLGSGTFATVYKTKGENAAAAKIVIVDKEFNYWQEPKILEYNLLSQLPQDHPNILYFFGFVTHTPIHYITMFPLMKCALEDELPIVNADRCTKLFKDIVSGIQFLHSNKVFHLDIKPENILIDECDMAKIADFDIAVDMKMVKAPVLTKYTACSKFARPPELLTETHYIYLENTPRVLKALQKIDMWSVGVVLYSMIYRTCPFIDKYSKENDNILEYIVDVYGIEAIKGISYEGLMKCPNGQEPDYSSMFGDASLTKTNLYQSLECAAFEKLRIICTHLLQCNSRLRWTCDDIISKVDTVLHVNPSGCLNLATGNQFKHKCLSIFFKKQRLYYIRRMIKRLYQNGFQFHTMLYLSILLYDEATIVHQMRRFSLDSIADACAYIAMRIFSPGCISHVNILDEPTIGNTIIEIFNLHNGQMYPHLSRDVTFEDILVQLSPDTARVEYVSSKQIEENNIYLKIVKISPLTSFCYSAYT